MSSAPNMPGNVQTFQSDSLPPVSELTQRDVIAGPIMIGCGEGGTSIEELAQKFPDKIITVPVDIREGITDAQANQMVDGLGVSVDRTAAAEQIKGLYNLFASCDCTMVEVGRQLLHATFRALPCGHLAPTA